MNFNYNQPRLSTYWLINHVLNLFNVQVCTFAHSLSSKTTATSIVIMYMISYGDRTFRARERERERWELDHVFLFSPRLTDHWMETYLYIYKSSLTTSLGKAVIFAPPTVTLCRLTRWWGHQCRCGAHVCSAVPVTRTYTTHCTETGTDTRLQSDTPWYVVLYCGSEDWQSCVQA